MADDKPVTKEIFIEASPEDIFPYLVERARYLKWMGVAVELEARPGGIFRVDPNGRDVILGRFVEVDPRRRVHLVMGGGRPSRASRIDACGNRTRAARWRHAPAPDAPRARQAKPRAS